MFGRTLALLVVLVCISSVACADPPATAQDKADFVAVEGNPPLTQGMIDRFAGFMEWLLDVPLTTGQRDDVATGLVHSWQTGDAEEKQGVVNVLSLAEQVAQREEAERALVREQLQALLLQQVRQMPDDPAAQWMLAVYEAGHQPIADGQPPLTRQMADAFAELMCFMIGEVVGQEVPTPPEFRTAAADLLAARYVELEPQGQQEVSQLPIVWAALRVAWPTLSDDDKDQYRSQWRGMLQGALPQQAAGGDQDTTQPAAPVADPGDSDLAALVEQKMAADPMQQAMTAQFMSNLLQTQHNGNMAMLYSMGGSGWTYQPRW